MSSRPSSGSEWKSLNVKFSGGAGKVNSSLCGTGRIADGKSGYCTVFLDFGIILFMFVKQK